MSVTLTNGKIVWFECHINGNSVDFGARVNASGAITASMGTMRLTESLTVVSRSRAREMADRAMLGSSQSVPSLSIMFNMSTEYVAALKNKHLIPAC